MLLVLFLCCAFCFLKSKLLQNTSIDGCSAHSSCLLQAHDMAPAAGSFGSRSEGMHGEQGYGHGSPLGRLRRPVMLTPHHSDNDAASRSNCKTSGLGPGSQAAASAYGSAASSMHMPGRPPLHSNLAPGSVGYSGGSGQLADDVSCCTPGSSRAQLLGSRGNLGSLGRVGRAGLMPALSQESASPGSVDDSALSKTSRTQHAGEHLG